VGLFAGFAGGPALYATASAAASPGPSSAAPPALVGRLSDPVFPHNIFRFRLRLATDMRDETAGAHRGKKVSRRLILVHVL